MTWKDRAQALTDCGWEEPIAVAFARAGGRCEYCGCGLLHERLPYAVGELDHLMPKSVYPNLRDKPANWVLACHLCNNIKYTYDPSEGMDITARVLGRNRATLIANARRHIYAARATEHDPAWIKVMRIMDG